MWYHIGMSTISRKSQSNKEDYKMTKEARQAQSRVRKLAALLAIGLLASGVVFAEGVGTVGLWKLDWTASTGLNLRSLVDPADDLSVEAAQTNPLGFGGIVQSSGGPSNPGSSEGFLDTPENVWLFGDLRRDSPGDATGQRPLRLRGTAPQSDREPPERQPRQRARRGRRRTVRGA